jgi:hypothetical protein
MLFPNLSLLLNLVLTLSLMEGSKFSTVSITLYFTQFLKKFVTIKKTVEK